MKPSLAEDAILEKIIFPVGVQPKIDGVRALNLTGKLTGRSLDPFEGFGITEYFSPLLPGGDGEMTLGINPASPDRLCSLTSGAMGRFKDVTSMADLYWWLFDYVTPDTVALPYIKRYRLLQEKVEKLKHPRLRIVPMQEIPDLNTLRLIMANHAQMKYEGTIIRNLNAVYKEGRATQKGQQLWRVKPWGDFEILVTGITEGQMNGNEAKTNTLGRTERSSSKAGMVPNGQVGSIQGVLVNDLIVNGGDLTIPKGTEITAGSGKMTVEEATDFFNNPRKIVGHYAKIKTMLHGVKDLPRFPTFESLRLKQDMS